MGQTNRDTKLAKRKTSYAPARSSGSLYHDKSRKAELKRIARIVKDARS